MYHFPEDFLDMIHHSIHNDNFEICGNLNTCFTRFRYK